MTTLPVLHVIFTMNCFPASNKLGKEVPKNWEQSGRAIDRYCARLSDAGFPATLFVAPGCAAFQAPLLEDLAARDVELGLLLHPQSLDRKYKKYLGQYGAEQQEEIIAASLRGFQDALRRRPQSVRSAMFSASDATYPLLAAYGFRQASLASPGRQAGKHAADWTGAVRDAHYASQASRLAAGDLPLLEIPVTTDADQVRGGLAPELAVENGTVDAWHRPLIEGQLERMERSAEPFRALCFYTRNCHSYHPGDGQLADTLDVLLQYLLTLEERYDVHPITVSGAHGSYHRLVVDRVPTW